jgi:hypothetical protein
MMRVEIYPLVDTRPPRTGSNTVFYVGASYRGAAQRLQDWLKGAQTTSPAKITEIQSVERFVLCSFIGNPFD